MIEAVQRSQFQLETAKRRLEVLQARRMIILESDYLPLQQDIEKIAIKSKIVELVNQRLSLKNICLRTLMNGFVHFGKYHTDPLACRDGITQDNAFADQPTEEAVYASLTDPNYLFVTVLKTFPAADRLDAQTPKEFVEKAMRQEILCTTSLSDS